jgi:hypothetical protein
MYWYVNVWICIHVLYIHLYIFYMFTHSYINKYTGGYGNGSETPLGSRTPGGRNEEVHI